MIQHILAEAKRLAAPATIPIIAAPSEDSALLNRSGFLLEAGGTSFLITAAHDLDILLHAPIYTSPSEPCGSSVQITADVVVTADDPEVDYAILQLTPEFIEQITPARTPLSIGFVSLANSYSEGLYLLHGYPSQSAAFQKLSGEQVFEVNPLTYITWPYSGAFKVGADPSTHIILHYPPRIELTDPSDARLQDTHLRGMSGCSIWQITQATTKRRRVSLSDLFLRDLEKDWTPSEIRLVGVQHRWNSEHGYSKGTWMRTVLSGIWDRFPKVRHNLEALT